MAFFKKEEKTASYWAGKIITAVEENELHKIKKYLTQPGADINAPDKNGQTPLRRAISCERLTISNYLMQQGADPKLADTIPSMPLICLAPIRNGYTIVKTLIDLDFDVNARDSNGNTALHHAARQGQGDTVRLLLGSGIDPNIRNNYSSNAADEADERYPRIADQIRQNASFKSSLINGEWEITAENEITRVSEKKVTGFVITEIFDFNMRSYINIVFNEKAKSQSHVTKSFSDLVETGLVEEAEKQMKQRGVDVQAKNSLRFDK